MKSFFHSQKSVIALFCVEGIGEEVTCEEVIGEGGIGEGVICEEGSGEEGIGKEVRCWVNGALSASSLGIGIGEEERGSGNGGEEGRAGNLALGIYLVEGGYKVETHIGA